MNLEELYKDDVFKIGIGIVMLICLLSILFSSCDIARAEEGIASYYGAGERLNKHTANGEVFNPAAMTCATYNYPFNTMLKVTNLDNDKTVIVRVNDRGPNKRLNRIIDLSREAFKRIASLKQGIARVRVERVR